MSPQTYLLQFRATLLKELNRIGIPILMPCNISFKHYPDNTLNFNLNVLGSKNGKQNKQWEKLFY